MSSIIEAKWQLVHKQVTLNFQNRQGITLFDPNNSYHHRDCSWIVHTLQGICIEDQEVQPYGGGQTAEVIRKEWPRITPDKDQEYGVAEVHTAQLTCEWPGIFAFLVSFI